MKLCLRRSGHGASILVALLGAGCTTAMYAGARRAEHEVAVIGSKDTRINYVDGKSVQDDFVGGTKAKFELLPGRHSVGISLDARSFKILWTEVKYSGTVTVCFDAGAGHRYTTVPIVSEDRWAPRIIDEASGRAVESPCRRQPVPVSAPPPPTVAHPRKTESNAALTAAAERAMDKARRVGVERLSPEERHFVAVWSLEKAVYAGGFAGYFLDHSGDDAVVAPQALRSIGAEATAGIVEQAIRPFGQDGVATDHTKRREQVQRFSPEIHAYWRGLDQKFVSDPDDLSRLLQSYLAANEARFRQER
jgi:hypothetical protein